MVVATHRHVGCSRRCWSCNFTWDSTRRDRLRRATWYEAAVEVVEAQVGEFTVPGLVPALVEVMSTPDAYDFARLAVRDMALHGLVECVERDRSGRRCLTWRVVGRL